MGKLRLHKELFIPETKIRIRGKVHSLLPLIPRNSISDRLFGRVSSRLNRSGVSGRWICKAVVSLNILTVLALTVLNRNTRDYRVSPDLVWGLAKQLKLGPCNFPKVEPFSEELQPFLGKPTLVNCVHQGNYVGEVLFKVNAGSRILRKVRSFHSDCCYRPFYRLNDQEIQTDNNCILIKDNQTVIPLEFEFIEVLCINGKEDYRDGFAIVQEKPDVEHWIQQTDLATERENANRLSLIILGIDATSRMNFLRTMPKSNKFLLKNLSAIVMKGYTKVAENTLPNVVPLLTGLTLEDFKEACVDGLKGNKGPEVHLDACPFVWKRFSSQGYRTSFAEDDVDIGIFNMNWGKAFAKPPTDFYLRPFSMRMQYNQGSGQGQCYGSRLSFKVLLDNIINTAVTFKDRPFFQFTWATKLSHNNFNQLSIGDSVLWNTLKTLWDGGHLNNTVLLLMSDHGSRIDDIRATRQGQLEDRLPLLYVILPAWFQEKYPEAAKNIQMNSNRLTSSFDVHETMKDLMDLKRLEMVDPDPGSWAELNKKGISLFGEIAGNRSCFVAGIPMHWCVCHEKTAAKLNSAEVLEAVDFAVGHLNYLLEGERNCATLRLAEIIEAWLINQEAVNKDAMEGKDPGELELLVHQVSFRTKPGDGKFEGTLIRDSEGAWMMTEQLVRTNSYGTQSHCVSQSLKQFCFCTN